MYKSFTKYVVSAFAVSCMLSIGAFATPVSRDVSSVEELSAEETSSSFHCSTNSDCSYHGSCDVETGVCHCDSGYTDDNCNYKQDKQLTAFLLHFFLGGAFGAGEFYVGNDGMGAGQLVLFWGTAILGGVAKRQENKCLAYTAGVGTLGVFVWWLVDAIRFGENDVEDGNGKSLKEW